MSLLLVSSGYPHSPSAVGQDDPDPSYSLGLTRELLKDDDYGGCQNSRDDTKNAVLGAKGISYEPRPALTSSAETLNNHSKLL